LQSYFYKKENLLSGLIFNKDNITIKAEYETVLRFYGYDLDSGTGSMLTESRMNGTAMNMTNGTEATDTTATTPESEMNTEKDDEVTTLPPETSSTDEVSGTEENTEENTTVSDEKEDATTVAPTNRKRRGRLGRGLKGKHRRDMKQSLAITNPLLGDPKRLSRSYYVLLDEDYDNEFHFEATSPIPLSSTKAYLLGKQSTTASTSSRPTASRHRDNSQKELFENTNSDSVEHIFYLNDYETVRVPFKIYDTVMKYAHSESLQASVLEIDLDTDHYNLIIIVPDHHDGLSDLTNKLRLHEASTFRRIRSAMEFYWVKTIVPKFNLKGNTILTNDLQNVSAPLNGKSTRWMFSNELTLPFLLAPLHDS
jgi:Serpin (serine protease inhibitor)